MSQALFSQVPLAPPDSILQLPIRYKADPAKQKINLSVGAYRDDAGNPWVLPVVKKATEIMLSDPAMDHEYLPIVGLQEFTSAAAKLILGADSIALKEDRVVSIQTLSGTGANHVGALFLSRFYAWNGPRQLYISNPTWGNHKSIMINVGITPVDYPYYDAATISLNLEGMLSALRAAPERSVILLHACAHNPTGVDPTQPQWAQIADVMLQKAHYAFFDCAYQGFASGDLDRDAAAVRYFEKRGVPMLVCQSFAKNAGLYGERVGALHVLCADKDEATRVRSQLSIIERAEISNPPAYGARLMAKIINDPALFSQWNEDIKTMAERIISMRQELYDLLTKELHTPGSWEHITTQIGMFSFTGLNAAQVQIMIERGHVYMTADGRISMAGLNSSNIHYFAEVLDKVVRGQL
ncbi:aspartate aminotransferase [Dacryopinax primogenitus]|uniref:Aspartate aminotransferase n=1 Tax=Dacryopinax primogenitus (strain DJM 731) TaxID=1858805 RepID=M5GEF3_DACPD|nr:aspartate aminotransferase [Dacryopinax primogenitus]EJU05387.1 aspartate aminotransferase [Dacryopinax primogenitus]